MGGLRIRMGGLGEAMHKSWKRCISRTERGANFYPTGGYWSSIKAASATQVLEGRKLVILSSVETSNGMELPTLSELGTVTYLSVHGPCCLSRAPRNYFSSFTSLQTSRRATDSDSSVKLPFYGVEVDSTACSTVYRQGPLCCNGDF